MGGVLFQHVNQTITTKEFKKILEENPDSHMHWMLPDKYFVPKHYHITEVGKVRKDYIDCGGTVRSKESCVLQVWVHDDADHRLKTDKLADIIRLAEGILGSDDLPVEIEYEQGVVSQYPIGGFEPTPSGPLFYLGAKHTACLAPDKCGVGNGCC